MLSRSHFVSSNQSVLCTLFTVLCSLRLFYQADQSACCSNCSMASSTQPRKIQYSGANAV